MALRPVLFQLCILARTTSYSNVFLKHYYFIMNGIPSSYNPTNSRFSISYFPLLYVDLFSDYYVQSIVYEFERDIGTRLEIDTWCYGPSPHSLETRDCDKDDFIGNTIAFDCDCLTRILKSEVRRIFTVKEISVFALDVFSTMYAGCYTSAITDGNVVEDLSDCIFDCERLNYSLAGVKERYCSCYNGFEGSMVRIDFCDDYCLEFQLCGSEEHTMLYFTNYRSFTARRSDESRIQCMFNPRSCPECPPGLIGINCDIRDCNINNGDCGDLPCDQFAEDSSRGGVCRCLPGYQLTSFSDCKEIDECAERTDACGSNMACNNTPGSFECSCVTGFHAVGDKCEDFDECVAKADECLITQVCINRLGSYECLCLTGYRKVGTICEEIDECAEGVVRCNNSMVCQNTPGSYKCGCELGFYEYEDTCEEETQSYNFSRRKKWFNNVSIFTYESFMALILISSILPLMCYVCRRTRYSQRSIASDVVSQTEKLPASS